MGQPPLPVTSQLIYRGYACFSYDGIQKTEGCTCVIAQLCFPPDPVCSFLAMKIMSGWALAEGGGPSEGGRWWSAKVAKVFSSGLCLPSRGDAGEVATALYLLFCGDALWGKIDDTLETFLVPLQDWLRVLIEIESAEIMESSSSDIDLSVSFIQVC